MLLFNEIIRRVKRVELLSGCDVEDNARIASDSLKSNQRSAVVDVAAPELDAFRCSRIRERAHLRSCFRVDVRRSAEVAHREDAFAIRMPRALQSVPHGAWNRYERLERARVQNENLVQQP